MAPRHVYLLAAVLLVQLLAPAAGRSTLAKHPSPKAKHPSPKAKHHPSPAAKHPSPKAKLSPKPKPSPIPSPPPAPTGVTADVGWIMNPDVTVSGPGRSYDNATDALILCQGDSAFFHWKGKTLAHNLAGVTEEDWITCNTAAATPGNTLVPFTTEGNATVTFPDVGSNYYICFHPGHCSANMKINITVEHCASR